MTIKVAQNASVSDGATISENASVWDFAQVREGAVVGENSIVGSYAYIDANVQIGKNCKIQNRALIYDPAVIHDGVFIGPGVILTNDKNPRSILGSGEVKSAKDWDKVGVEVLQGAAIGSGAICVAPVKIGKWALVGAGAVVTKDVKDYALVVGNPARQVGWVDHNGHRLVELEDGQFQSTSLGTLFQILDGKMVVVK